MPTARMASLAQRVSRLVVLGLLLGPAGRAVTIDDFDVSSAGGTLVAVGSGSVTGAGGLGGQVDGEFSMLSGSGSFRCGLNTAGSEGYLFASVETLNTASLTLQWDGAADAPASTLDLDGLGSVDLTDGAASNAVLLAIAWSDGLASFSMTVHSSGGTGSSTVTRPLPFAAAPATLAIPFSDFAGDADFADASAVAVTFDLPFGADFLIDSIATGDGAAGSTFAPPFSFPTVPVVEPPGSFVIESFAAGSSSGFDLGPGGGGSTGLVNASSLGGHVVFDFDNLAAAGSMAADRDGPGGLLHLHNDPIAHGRARVTWHGATGAFNPAGLGSVDLTSGGAHDRILVGHRFADVAATITLRAHSNGGTALSTGVLEIPAAETSGDLHELPFASFTGNADFSQLSALELEVDWGVGLDLTLDFLAAGAALPVADLALEGNGLAIADGDATPEAADHTDFGFVAVGSWTERTFTLRNDGDLDATLGPPPAVTVAGAGAFTVEVQATTPVPSGGGSTTFVVRFAPAASGPASATVSIGSDDPDESPYSFAVAGTGFASATEVPAQGAPGAVLLALLLAGAAIARHRAVRHRGGSPGGPPAAPPAPRA